MLLLRSIFFTFLMPGTVTVLVPYWLISSRGAGVYSNHPALRYLGIPLIAIGSAGLLWSIWEFFSEGRGTLAPVDPPKYLVVRGLYRYVRNPMYVSVLTTLLGVAIFFMSPAVLTEAGVFVVLVHLFVLFYEEPALRRTFGESYERYLETVGRWIPRIRLVVLALLLLATPITGIAQKSVTEYTPTQRAALQAFLDKNPSYQFVPETWFDKQTLKAARNEWGFGRSFKPYFKSGDFNRDGIRDFAVVLLTGKESDDPHSRMHVIVFDGIKGGKYRVAHIEHEESSKALFIGVNRHTLLVGVMETDSAGCFVPTRRGYIVKPCGK